MGAVPPKLPVIKARKPVIIYDIDIKCDYCKRVYKHGTKIPATCYGCGAPVR